MGQLSVIYHAYLIDERFVDIVHQIFPFLTCVDEQEERRFSDFIARRPITLWPSNLEPEREVMSASQLFDLAVQEMHEDPRGDLLTFADSIEEDRQKNFTLQSRVTYSLTGWLFSHGSGSMDDTEIKCLTSCLAICAPFLDDELQSSMWLVYGRVLTTRLNKLDETALVEKAEEWLFPFRVSIYLKHDSVDAHLDLAVLIYQIRARLGRFSRRVNLG